jgi:hypothetical protein
MCHSLHKVLFYDAQHPKQRAQTAKPVTVSTRLFYSAHPSSIRLIINLAVSQPHRTLTHGPTGHHKPEISQLLWTFISPFPAFGSYFAPRPFHIFLVDHRVMRTRPPLSPQQAGSVSSDLATSRRSGKSKFLPLTLAFQPLPPLLRRLLQ